jgi:hypothetical protein
MPTKLSTEGWIKKAQKKWGTRFDYTRVNYINCNTSVEVGCPEHGFMFIDADSHIYSKTGCFDCGKKQQWEKQKTTFNEFKKLAEEKHGKLYTYTKNEYESLKSKIKIHCNKHKFDFKQTAAAHLTGQGCPKCGREKINEGSRFTKEEFIKKANEVFIPNNTDYTKLDLNNLTEDKKGIFICENGHEYEQVIYSHLSGIGCGKCKGFNKTTDEFILESKMIHGNDVIDYSKVIYINSSTPIVLTCKKHSIDYSVLPNHHLGKSKVGCQLCSGKGWAKEYLINFILSLQNELTNLDSIELITIINSNNLAHKLSRMGRLNNLISARAGSQERQEIINDILNIVEGITEEEEENDNVEGNTLTNNVQDILTEEQINNVITTQENEDETPRTNVVEELRVYDNNTLTSSLDDENVDFLLKSGLKKVWANVLKDNFDIESYRNEIGGDNFNIIKGWFFDEYDEAMSLQIPNDLNRNYIPNLMQRLVTIRNIREKSYGNWSDTGTGKTLASLITGRVANAKNVLIICNNATVDGWVKSIKDYFPKSNTYTKKTVSDKYDFQIIDGEWNYLIFNYETFQQKDGEYMAYQIANNNRIDYCILDEIHNIKQREVENESIRRSVVVKLVTTLREKNENFMLTGMSATPIINNFQEPKAIIELLTGKVHKEIDVTENVQNGIELYKLLTRHGLRYKGKKITRVNLDIRRINGNHLFENINQLSSGDLLGTELLLLQDKLESVRDVITDGKMIFVNNVGKGILKRIGDFVNSLGLTYGYCTGDDKEGLDKFKRGQINVLIGSTPITTGVDGLQHRCNGIIKLILPWTNAEDKQLDGRVIDRTGCIFDEVDVIIPQVYVEDEEGNVIWDWDKWRYDRVKFKKTLMDLVLDGEIPEGKLPSKQKLLQDALTQLDIWKQRIENGEILTTQREELKVPLSGEYSGQLQRRLGDFSEMNRVWSISNSRTTSERLLESPEEWYQYHTLYSEKRKEWNEIPYKVIGKKISSRPDWIVGDFGCGENLLSKEINNQVYAFDHIAIDDDVIACDISDVSEYLNDNVLDVVVNSLSLMGSNYLDYLREEHRTLKPYGIIMICEPKSKWEGRENELISVLEEIGFNCRIVRTTDKFIYIDGNKI